LLKDARVLDGGALNEYGDSVIAEVGRTTGLRLGSDTGRPTGIVALNDLLAIGLMAGLRETGLRVPHDVSVIGIDGLFLSAVSNPTLTTVQLPIREMALAMVEQVMTQWTGSGTCELVFAPAGLIERGSVASPPTADLKRQANKLQTAKPSV
jgi:DNA-binding LacI/PurR family transcriptional regulator